MTGQGWFVVGSDSSLWRDTVIVNPLALSLLKASTCSLGATCRVGACKPRATCCRCTSAGERLPILCNAPQDGSGRLASGLLVRTGPIVGPVVGDGGVGIVAIIVILLLPSSCMALLKCSHSFINCRKLLFSSFRSSQNVRARMEAVRLVLGRRRAISPKYCPRFMVCTTIPLGAITSANPCIRKYISRPSCPCWRIRWFGCLVTWVRQVDRLILMSIPRCLNIGTFSMTLILMYMLISSFMALGRDLRTWM
mmetsp:Transcript_109197/g.189224  ORF Transcript_109197/g.189224 Transcript_109197/m.189224 type:complete len:252 (+) Transcript_109197:853-1608(+)